VAYVELGAVRTSLGEQTPTRDDLIEAAISAAEKAIDNTCGRTFAVSGSATARVFAPNERRVLIEDGEVLIVDDIGSLTDLAVESGSGGSYSAVSASTYEAWPLGALTRGWPVTALLALGGCWPTGTGRVRVTARWGWPSVPADVTQATLLLATRLYRRKDSPEGVIGSADFGLLRVTNRDPDVRALLEPYVLSGA
jgi:hypothetical protein